MSGRPAAPLTANGGAAGNIAPIPPPPARPGAEDAFSVGLRGRPGSVVILVRRGTEQRSWQVALSGQE